MQFQMVYTRDVEVATQIGTKNGIDLHIKKRLCKRAFKTASVGLWASWILSVLSQLIEGTGYESR